MYLFSLRVKENLERREKRPVLKPMWNLAICTLSRPSSPGSRFLVTTIDVQAEFHYCVGSLVFHPKFIGQSFSTIAMVSALGAGSRMRISDVDWHLIYNVGSLPHRLTFLIASPRALIDYGFGVRLLFES